MANPRSPVIHTVWNSYRMVPDPVDPSCGYTLLVADPGMSDPSAIYIFVNPQRRPLDLDYIAYSRIVRVGDPSTYGGLEFRRLTCYQYIPQDPGSRNDFRLPSEFDLFTPVHVCIIPPTDIAGAIRSASFSSDVPHPGMSLMRTRRGGHATSFYTSDVSLEEAVIDMRIHRNDIFCTVFSSEPGVYRVVHIFSCSGRPSITESTLIFAPSVWSEGARVLANNGSQDGISKLICRLSRGDNVELWVETEFVSMEPAYGPSGDNGESWQKER
ncbi:hypothetical protein B0H16DRAFT_1465188 [Mycena metata]|uniref:Uncharacterized protein n=1 Tax=Mycena metata TaxID=1033252 RepID=A0AAD7MZ74_9AGAR|nr:hypothetical protein B0H16DRAFT_1465188 [Mycena metata]